MSHPANAIGEKVLEVYKKENPSTYKIEEDHAAFEKLRIFADDLYTHSLKLLPRVFNGADLLEFGSGTGERSLAYLRWGAKCTFVDMNEEAIARARFLFEKFEPSAQYEFVRGELFNYRSERLYDITASCGVIHHTDDKAAAFAHQVSFLKPGGINILGIGSAAGSIQRNLQRHIIYTFAGRDEEAIQRVANDLFEEHLDRAEKLGGRARKAVIFDTYVNPRMDFVSVADIVSWHRQNGLKLFTSWPPVTPAVLADNLANRTDLRAFPEVLSNPEWLWATQKGDDSEFLAEMEIRVAPFNSAFRELADSINDVRAEQLNPTEILGEVERCRELADVRHDRTLRDIRGLGPWLDEVATVMQAIERKDYEGTRDAVLACKHLFRGRQGIGLNYFVGIKE
ncbi:class I SAM-dependent methyltransferase [Altererythrobacter sp. SALINAS58]|uniref:class I SAM-dependent methyltransferase n=1 Tax=Alteripontixanthobacter muriae TaxID=2705546 RepID=UPI0015777679|nr:class I SAM-dependent methyltransferase [Alteripontixanthobacter muriae]NTZ42834.1 class I SAM-dependent methyltransferase [Alteripontixanthobacter muriae]